MLIAHGYILNWPLHMIRDTASVKLKRHLGIGAGLRDNKCSPGILTFMFLPVLRKFIFVCIWFFHISNTCGSWCPFLKTCKLHERCFLMFCMSRSFRINVKSRKFAPLNCTQSISIYIHYTLRTYTQTIL